MKKLELTEINNFDDLVVKTIDKVKRLISDDQIKPRDIGIIVENITH